MKLFKWCKSWVTMKRDPTPNFRDIVSGDMVYNYTDCYGDKYLANYVRWGFRVKV